MQVRSAARRPAAGEGAGQGGQRPRAPRHDPVGMALPDVPEGSALAQWYRRKTTDGRGTIRKTMIVALARKLLVALWQLVTTGEVPEGVVLRPVGRANTVEQTTKARLGAPSTG